MACNQTIRRNQEVITFTPDATSVGKLQRNYDYSFIWLFLNVQYTITANNPTLNYNHFANLIRTISIFGNGNTEFKNQDFASMVFQTYLLTKGKLLAPVPDLTYSDSDAESNKKSYVLPILLPLESLNMNYISDTGLLSSNYQTLDLQVNWTNSSAVGKNIEVTAASLKPVSFEKILQLNSKGQLDKIPARLIQKTQSEQISTSSEGILINVPPRKWYNSFQIDILNGLDGSAVVGAIKKIKFLQGVDVLCDIDFEKLQIDNQRRFDLDTMGFKTIYKDAIAKNQTLNPDAHAILDFSTDGDYSNSLVTQGFTMPQIALDTVLPNGIQSIKVKITCNYVETI